MGLCKAVFTPGLRRDEAELIKLNLKERLATAVIELHTLPIGDRDGSDPQAAWRPQ